MTEDGRHVSTLGDRVPGAAPREFGSLPLWERLPLFSQETQPGKEPVISPRRRKGLSSMLIS